MFTSSKRKAAFILLPATIAFALLGTACAPTGNDYTGLATVDEPRYEPGSRKSSRCVFKVSLPDGSNGEISKYGKYNCMVPKGSVIKIENGLFKGVESLPEKS